MSRCSRFLKALSDLNRLKILELLFKNELCVSDIVKALKIDQPKVSHHLSILKAAGIVLNRRNGRTIIYSLHPAVAKKSEHMGKIDTGFCSVEFRFRHKKEPGETKEKEMQ
jgi:ArsR family transcriptional regulator